MNTCQNGTIEPYLKHSNSSSYLFFSPNKIYGQRYGIEVMFKDSKTGGYNLEGSQASPDIMSGSITIIKPQLGATNGSLSNLELSLAVGVIVGSD